MTKGLLGAEVLLLVVVLILFRIFMVSEIWDTEYMDKQVVSWKEGPIVDIR